MRKQLTKLPALALLFGALVFGGVQYMLKR